jgi:hypothetical protein
MKTWQKIVLAFLAILVVGGLLMLLPPVQERVLWRLDQLRIRVFYLINPPEEEVFTPDDEVAAVVQATLTQLASQSTLTPTATATATQTPLPPEAPTPTITPSPTPLPPSALIADVPYVDQHYGFNNCAPANLTMALHFWGWAGTREDVSNAVKPFAKDKNVMPYELADFVNYQTSMRATWRNGGTLDLLKTLVAAGYPVVVERGVYLRDLSGKVSWMGHYQVVYGYDDGNRTFNVKDSFEEGGDQFVVSDEDLMRGWRSFNYAFIVVYPPEYEGSVLSLLGVYADEAAANRNALQMASEEATELIGQDQFFALYNRGTSLYLLADFTSAAEAYDEAFRQYATLSGDKRPWRIVWYQTGPYFAYFNTGRYVDVINLADKTIKSASEPFLEESFYWRARAKAMTGDTQGAIEDLNKSLEYHPDFNPSVALLASLGGGQ